MTPEYREFLARKAPRAMASGLAKVPPMHDKMKPHQRDVTEFCLRQGRADINQTNTLNVAMARDHADERHICPLQLDLITRCLVLWSNPGDTVLSPFMGIGSEGVQSLRERRKFVGIELKESYFRQAVKYLTQADAYTDDLFSRAAE